LNSEESLDLFLIECIFVGCGEGAYDQ